MTTLHPNFYLFRVLKKKPNREWLYIVIAVLLLSFLWLSSRAQGTETKFTITKGYYYASPLIRSRCGDTVEYSMVLDSSWYQLYSNANNSTIKVSGVGSYLGFNSIRMGVRINTVAPKNKGLIACAYVHNNRAISYPALKDTVTHKTVFIAYGVKYFVRMNKESGGWRLSLFDARHVLIASYVAPISITGGNWIQEVYAEPSNFNMTAYLQFLEK